MNLGEWTSYVWNAPVAGVFLLLALFAAATVRRGRAEAAAPHKGAIGLTLAARTSICVGAGSAVGGALAVELGGPGALIWMWIATAAGLGLLMRETEAAAPRKATIGSRKSRTWPAALGLLVMAIVVGGAFQSKQLAHAVPFASASGQWATTLLVAAAAAAVASWRFLAHAWWTFLSPIAIAAFVLVAMLTAFHDPMWLQLRLGDAWQHALGLGTAGAGVASGGMAVAFSQGVLWAIVGGELGLGSARQEVGLRPSGRSLRGIVVPLAVVVVVSTASALVVLTQPQERRDIVAGDLVPLERHLSRGLRPSTQAGQTIVLPEDAGFEAGKAYAMQLRSNPRGHRLGHLMLEENAVVLPAWALTRGIDTVVFRSRDARNDASWDVRVPVVQEHVPIDDGHGFVRLRPADPELLFRRLLAQEELDSTPYVVVPDPQFVGVVDEATSPDPALGRHLAMYEPEYEGRPFNPALHEFFRQGFRGPYPASDGPRPPWAYPAAAEFEAPLGTTHTFLLEPDPRGIPVLRVNRAGSLEAPPWDILMDVREVVVRHVSDPSRDIVIPVEPRLRQHRIRFDVLDSEWKDFRRLATLPEFGGVYARVRPVTFKAEVHGDTRLPEAFKGHLSLVPIHPLPEPQGPYGTLPYAPHPEELRALGFRGPYLVHEGVATLQSNIREHVPGWGPIVLLGALFTFVVGTVAGWGQYARVALAENLGPRFGLLALLLVLLAAAASPLWQRTALVQLTAVAVFVGLIPNLALTLRSRRRK